MVLVNTCKVNGVLCGEFLFMDLLGLVSNMCLYVFKVLLHMSRVCSIVILRATCLESLLV